MFWEVTEKEYREDSAISYSLMASYQKLGPEVLTIEREEPTSSMIFGSLVDTLAFEPNEFDNRFIINDGKMPSETIQVIINNILSCGDTLASVPDDTIMYWANFVDYGKTWKNETRLNKIIMEGSDYFRFKKESEGRYIISQKDHDDACNCVVELRSNPFTRNYFVNENDFAKNTFQVKMKISYDNVDPLYWKNQIIEENTLKGMADIVHIDKIKKTIGLVDLKTTSGKERDFIDNYEKYFYDIQQEVYDFIFQRLYFNLADDPGKYSQSTFKFIVINRNNLSPLVYEIKPVYNRKWTDKYGKNHVSFEEIYRNIKWNIENKEYRYTMNEYHNNGIIRKMYNEI
jgi:hypothetical protein